jgi:hypothetical protein
LILSDKDVFFDFQAPVQYASGLEKLTQKTRYKRKPIDLSFSDLNENSAAYIGWKQQIEAAVNSGVSIESAVNQIAMSGLR